MPQVHRLILPLLLALGVSACESRGVAITDRAQITQAVQGQLNLWTRAFNNRSLDTLALLYVQSRDVIVVWPEGAPTHGWNDTARRLKEWADALTQFNFLIQN